MEKMIQIPEWQFKHIENALRLTHRINKCASKETAFDREVVKAYQFATEALANAPTSGNSLHKHFVNGSACECLSEWMEHKREEDAYPYGDTLEYDQCKECGKKYGIHVV